MKKNYLEIARQIIRQAEERAGKKYQEATNETLPRQLEILPRDEHNAHYRRRLQEIRKFYYHKLPNQGPYQPYFDLYKYGAEQLAFMLKDWLIDSAREGASLQERELWAVNRISEKEFARRYMLHLVGLLDGQPEARKAQPEKEEPAFEHLFTLPSVPALVIRAMQEAEPAPLLNEDREAILFGKATVSPVLALVDILFDRRLVKEDIDWKEAYLAICSRFTFETSKSRPDKARKRFVYQDYKEAFKEFFLNNRPE